VSVSSSGGQPSNVYINNDILYIPDYALGYIYQVTTPLTSTSYPYSTTTLLSGFSEPVCTIISSQGYVYILGQGTDEVYQYVSGSPTNYQPIFGSGQGLAGVGHPFGLAFDSTESHIYVSDASNGQILMISVTSTPGTDGVLVAVSYIAEFALTHRLIH
jgi:hypothetical protein